MQGNAQTKKRTDASKTRADSARVPNQFESLDVEATKKVYIELNGVLEGLANTAIHTLDQMVPQLDKMQSLLSQRGASRKQLLNDAGLPGWMAWAKEYAARFDCSVRTIQDRINLFRRAEDGGARGPKKSKGAGDKKPLRLDYRQQSALVKAQLVVNDVVEALKNGGDWQTPLAKYDQVAVTPAKLDSFVNLLDQQPDWENVLSKLVGKLAEHSDGLPPAVISEMRSAEKLLEGRTTAYQVSGPEPETQTSAVPAALLPVPALGDALLPKEAQENTSDPAAAPEPTLSAPATPPEEGSPMSEVADSEEARRRAREVFRKVRAQWGSEMPEDDPRLEPERLLEEIYDQKLIDRLHVAMVENRFSKQLTRVALWFDGCSSLVEEVISGVRAEHSPVATA
jgi:hypothetical protein